MKTTPETLTEQDGDPAPKNPTDEAMATIIRDRQERMRRCGTLIDEALQREKCILYAPIGITDDGRIIAPQIKVRAID